MQRFAVRIALSVFWVALLMCVGCSSKYGIDRRRDAGDVFTCTLGWGVGVKAQVSGANLGLVARWGELGLHNGFPGGGSWDMQLLFWGLQDLELSKVERKRGKELGTPRGPMQNLVIPYRPRDVPAWYYGDVNIIVGLGPSVKLGVNFVELADLVVGLFGVDILDDDIGEYESDTPAQDGHGSQ